MSIVIRITAITTTATTIKAERVLVLFLFFPLEDLHTTFMPRNRSLLDNDNPYAKHFPKNAAKIDSPIKKNKRYKKKQNRKKNARQKKMEIHKIKFLSIAKYD